MIELDLNLFLTAQGIEECRVEAVGRTAQHVQDSLTDENASYSYGAKAPANARPYHLRLEDSYIGAIAESLVSKIFQTKWTKERRQYKTGGSKPDLVAFFRGRETDVEVQGTRMEDAVPVRPRDFGEWKEGRLLAVVTNMPNGPMVKVGYKYFSDLAGLCSNNLHWLRARDSKRPYYAVPIDIFDFKYEDFLWQPR